MIDVQFWKVGSEAMIGSARMHFVPRMGETVELFKPGVIRHRLRVTDVYHCAELDAAGNHIVQLWCRDEPTDVGPR